MMHSSLAYHNGDWLPDQRLAFSLSDPAVTQGVSAVERIRVYNGHPFQWTRHLERWHRTVTALQIQGLPDSDKLEQIVQQLFARNRAWLASQASFGILMLASPGSADRSTFVMQFYALESDVLDRRVAAGSPLVVTDVQQPPNASWSRNIKVRSRLHYYRADQIAGSTVPEAFGVLIDQDGSITETSLANVLIVEAGRLVSPLPEQILKGVSLQVITDIAASIGVSLSRERILPGRFRLADEVLLTGTSCGVWFANSVDGGPTRGPGPIYDRLRATFDELIRTG